MQSIEILRKTWQNRSFRVSTLIQNRSAIQNEPNGSQDRSQAGRSASAAARGDSQLPQSTGSHQNEQSVRFEASAWLHLGKEPIFERCIRLELRQSAENLVDIFDCAISVLTQ